MKSSNYSKAKQSKEVEDEDLVIALMGVSECD